MPHPSPAGAELQATLAALHLHPVKSGGALTPASALLVETGLDLDRAWMVVDADGDMLTQRELPRLALLSPQLKGGDLVLRAPGMLALHLSLDRAEAPTRVRVWDDVVPAYEMGALAAQWISDFLRPDLHSNLRSDPRSDPPSNSSRPLRLVRFDPEHRRLSSQRWTGAVQAENQFTDGFPLLVTNTASLDDLNARLADRGQAPVTMARFRPNLVLVGLQAWDEDHIDTLTVSTDDGPVRLQLVKPCVRCSIPNVDPVTAATSDEPGATLATFRADPRMDGGLTFGINAVVLEGFGHTLRCGQAVTGSWKF